MSDYHVTCTKCGWELDSGGLCSHCGRKHKFTVTTQSNDYLYIEPNADAKIIMQQQKNIAELQARIDEYEFVGILFGVMIYAKSPEDAKKISDMSKAMSVGQKDFTPPFLVEIDLASRVHIASLESERREFDKIIREYEQAKAEAEKQRVELEKWNAERYVGCVTHIANQQSRIDTLESENKALRLIAGSHSMSELRRNRTMAGWRRGDTLKNEVKHESKYY